MPTISYRGKPGDVSERMRDLALALAGKGPDAWGVVQALQLRVAVRLLQLIQDDFERKAQGQTGEDGIKWAPLARATIAGRRIGPGELKRVGITGKRERGFLTPAENARWRKLFSRRKWLLFVKFGMDEGAASAAAAKYAWYVLKSEGAKTKLEVLGGRTVPILRDTGELFRSFSPGTGDAPGGADGQILRLAAGLITVGTNKKPWHHAGIPGRLPARPFWPTNGALPDPWQKALCRTLQRGMIEALAMVFSKGKP